MTRNENLDTIKEDLAEINNRVHQLEGNVGNQVKELTKQVKHNAIEKKEEIENRVIENPLTSVGIAFGTGVVAGMVAKHFIEK